MKKIFLLLAFAGPISLQAWAQSDDMYFMPSKSKAKDVAQEAPAYYVGSSRNVDEYNRRGRFCSHYQPIGGDSLSADVFEFQKGAGVYPDSSYVDTSFAYENNSYWDDEDFRYTRRMSRWDGFYNPWFYGYWGPRYYGFYDPLYDPWCYGGYGGWYGCWYGGWYDPWYYGYAGYYGWGWPYYRGWYGWGWNYPYWGGVHIHYAGGNPRGLTGNRTWSYGAGSKSGVGSTSGRYNGAYGNRVTTGSRNSYTSRSNNNRSFGSRTNRTYNSNSQNRTYTPSRSYNSFGSNTPSSGSFGGSVGGGFGGSRSGGGFGGGHSGGGGGGHFGGGRR